MPKQKIHRHHITRPWPSYIPQFSGLIAVALAALTFIVTLILYNGAPNGFFTGAMLSFMVLIVLFMIKQIRGD